MSETLLPEQRRAMDYLAHKGTGASTDKLRDQLQVAFAAIESAFDAVPTDRREFSPAAGKWSAHEILDHLVLSHEPAIPQLASLLAGVSPSSIAVPADLHRSAEARPAWNALRSSLGEVHHEFMRLMASASDDLSLDAKAAVEIVVKVDSMPKHWIEHLDWKAFVQAIRVHTIEHQNQLTRTISGS